MEIMKHFHELTDEQKHEVVNTALDVPAFLKLSTVGEMLTFAAAVQFSAKEAAAVGDQMSVAVLRSFVEQMIAQCADIPGTDVDGKPVKGFIAGRHAGPVGHA
jgi:hypothetical protein